MQKINFCGYTIKCTESNTCSWLLSCNLKSSGRGNTNRISSRVFIYVKFMSISAIKVEWKSLSWKFEKTSIIIKMCYMKELSGFSVRTAWPISFFKFEKKTRSPIIFKDEFWYRGILMPLGPLQRAKNRIDFYNDFHSNALYCLRCSSFEFSTWCKLYYVPPSSTTYTIPGGLGGGSGARGYGSNFFYFSIAEVFLQLISSRRFI